MKTTYCKSLGFAGSTYYVEYVINDGVAEIILAYHEDGPSSLDVTIERLNKRLEEQLVEELVYEE